MATSKTDRATFTVDAIKADVDQAVFLGNSLQDNMLSCMIAMGAEMWSTRRRMKVMESLLEDKGVSPELMEAYMPSETQISEWNADRDAFVKRIFGYLERDGDKPMSTDSEDS